MVLAERSSGKTKVAPRGFAEDRIESLTVARGVEERAKLISKKRTLVFIPKHQSTTELILILTKQYLSDYSSHDIQRDWRLQSNCEKNELKIKWPSLYSGVEEITQEQTM